VPLLNDAVQVDEHDVIPDGLEETVPPNPEGLMLTVSLGSSVKLAVIERLKPIVKLHGFDVALQYFAGWPDHWLNFQPASAFAVRVTASPE
jgi:hypothetical protein